MRDYSTQPPPVFPYEGDMLPPEEPRKRKRIKRRTPLGIIKLVLMHLIGWPIVLLTLVALLAEVGMLLLLAAEHGYTGRLYPNINIRGINVGNLTNESASATLENRYAEFLFNPVELRYLNQSWYPTAEDLGIELQFEAAVEDAATIGRTQSRMENSKTVAAVWEHGVEVPLHMEIDQKVMQNYLLQVARSVEKPPQNADMDLQGAEIVVTHEHMGVQVLIDETIEDITAAVQHMGSQRVTLRTRKITPMVRDTDIAPVIAEVRGLLEAPISLASTDGSCAQGCRWEWSVEDLARWIRLIRGVAPDGRPTISVQTDQTAIRNALVPIAEAVRKEGTLPRLNWNDGNLSIIQPGLPGRGLDVTLTQSYINVALSGGPRSLVLPLVDIPPPINETNLATVGIVKAIGTGVSSFSGSQNYRITNITAGARRIHGILISPGEEFSFNDSLGPVDASGGFVMGSAIVNNRTQQEWGGGLCQVSTTMFRAAFWAGLPITERHAHKFRITWYEELGEPPGFDAAIFTGADNVRFVNDTGGLILIQTWVDTNRQRLYITLYGTETNRQVEMNHTILKHIPKPTKSVTVKDPKLPAGTRKQTDWAQPGLSVEVYRYVSENGQLIRRDTFPTTFEAWPDVFVEGTGR